MELSDNTKCEIRCLKEVFDTHLLACGAGRTPKLFHRIALLAEASTLIGKNVWIQTGGSRVYVNLNILLVGEKDAEAQAAIERFRATMRLMRRDSFAADEVTRIGFLRALRAQEDLEACLKSNTHTIACANYQNFFQHATARLIGVLNNLWHVPKIYEAAENLSSGKAADNKLTKPYLTLFSAITPRGFIATFPDKECVTEDMLAQTLLVYGEATETTEDKFERGVPPSHDTQETLKRIRAGRGKRSERTEMTEEALKGCAEINATVKREVEEGLRGHNEVFSAYWYMRPVHLQKLAMVCMLLRGGSSIGLGDVLVANTLLYAIERRMAQALGGFGRKKHAQATTTVLNAVRNAERPLSLSDLERVTSTRHGTSMHALLKIAGSLKNAGMLQTVQTTEGQSFVSNLGEKRIDKSRVLKGFISEQELNYAV